MKITIILAGISDVPLIRRATEHLYSTFLRDHIQIYEWETSVLHGKAAVIDNQWSTIGSFNLNSLSCYGSIEMNVEIYSTGFAKALRSDFSKVLNECREITESKLKQRASIINSLADWLVLSGDKIYNAFINIFTAHKGFGKLQVITIFRNC